MDVNDLLALRTGTIPGWRFTHTVQDLGLLHVPSGQLGASDPFVNLPRSFAVTVPPGSYPVSVTIADVSEEQDGSHPRETYLSVVLAPGEPTRAERLRPTGADPDAGEDATFGVSVNAGTVAFVDREAVKPGMPDDEGDWYDDVFDSEEPDSWFELMDAPEHLRAGCANITLPRATAGENVVLAHSGWGDGFFPVIGAYDADGQLLSVHIDLQVDTREEAAAS
jgi:hypothetical protein